MRPGTLALLGLLLPCANTRKLLFGTIAEGAEQRGASSTTDVAPRADPNAIRRLHEARDVAAPDCAKYSHNHDGHQQLLEVRGIIARVFLLSRF